MTGMTGVELLKKELDLAYQDKHTYKRMLESARASIREMHRKIDNLEDAKEDLEHSVQVLTTENVRLTLMNKLPYSDLQGEVSRLRKKNNQLQQQKRKWKRMFQKELRNHAATVHSLTTESMRLNDSLDRASESATHWRNEVVRLKGKLADQNDSDQEEVDINNLAHRLEQVEQFLAMFMSETK